jgi:hypothetical protein
MICPSRQSDKKSLQTSFFLVSNMHIETSNCRSYFSDPSKNELELVVAAAVKVVLVLSAVTMASMVLLLMFLLLLKSISVVNPMFSPLQK